jgi:hypothetical protein
MGFDQGVDPIDLTNYGYSQYDISTGAMKLAPEEVRL